MSFLKIENGAIKEAPYKLKTAEYTVYGYNAIQNRLQCEKDGYTWYEKGIYAYQLRDGEIKEKQDTEDDEL